MVRSGGSIVRVMSVVGARPNFMKLAPVARELAVRPGIEHLIVHTGQHYDPEMSSSFFADLAIPAPHHNLGVGSGSHATQTAAVMVGLEPLLNSLRPTLLLVYGDVNSTVAASLVAAKAGIAVGHVEAGLRSGDWSMPEEVNRVVTDRLADILLTPSRDADANLRAEGISPDRIHLVGNVMIDSLVYALPAARGLDLPRRHGLKRGEYVVVTLHRPSNVDDPPTLAALMRALSVIARDRIVLFAVHPRTRHRLAGLGFDVPANTDLRLLEPLTYLDMLGLVTDARLVITDSGGLQEETTFLGVPCLTARRNTERPITVDQGTNRLVESTTEGLVAGAREALAREPARSKVTIEHWDGRAAVRIADAITRRAETGLSKV